jgi:ABC-2 type transport system permease protein
MPLFFLSGALFPLQGLPRAFTIVASLDPLSYGVDGLRGTLVSGAHFGLGPDLIILGVITAIVLAIGSYLFSKIQI